MIRERLDDDGRCLTTELLPGQCACPAHRGTPADFPTLDGPQPFRAARNGTCGVCDGPIRPGQQIIKHGHAYAHTECAV